MLTPSLIDILKENEKVKLDDSSIAVSIEDVIGFAKEQNNINIFEQLRMKENLTEKERSAIELAEIYLPAFARFKPGEVMEYLHADVQDIKKNTMERKPI